jgi:surfactin synthase thioesterase subunit
VSTGQAEDPWTWIWALHSPADVPSATILVLPHAGGSAHGYSDWADHVRPDLRLLAAQYPGRGARHREPLPEDVRSLALPLPLPLASAAADLSGPLYIFGHSLGALVGFEVAWILEQRGRELHGFVASACRAPHRPNTRPIRADRLSDDELVVVLRRRGGTPDEILDNPDMRGLVLPIVRSDFNVDDSYEYGPAERRLRCPVVAIGGTADPQVPVDVLDGWRELSQTETRVHTMNGGHFYFADQMPKLMGILHRMINPSARQPAATIRS